MKWLVFGDASGWFAPLEEALIVEGCSLEDTYLSDGISVVHVGDLIHKGDDSDLLVAKVDAMMEKYPGRCKSTLATVDTDTSV